MPGDLVEACPFSITFDWRPQAEPVPDVVRASFELTGRSWAGHVRDIHDTSRFAAQPFDELLAEERRYGHVPCAMQDRFWAMLGALRTERPDIVERVVQNALRDLEHEPIFVLGLLIALCTDGLVNVGEPDDFGRLNAARRKRGRPDLLPFRDVTASGRNVIRLSDRGGQLETMQAIHAA